MNYKRLRLVALRAGLIAIVLFPIAATAQVTTLQYDEGIFSGNVTLSAPLPQAGSFTVSPTEFDFLGIGYGAGYNYACPACGYSLGGAGEDGSASFSFTTRAGRISGWSINIDFTDTPGTNTSTSLYALISPRNDSFLQQTTGPICEPDGCPPQSFSSDKLGVWTASTAAPEIDPASAMSGLTLLLGGLAVLRGRRKLGVPPSRVPPHVRSIG